MKIKKFLSRPGISFIEVLVSLSIIAILTLLFTMNITSQQQTAKKEAERIAEYLHDLMRQSDRIHRSFNIKFYGEDIVWFWEDEPDDENYWKPIYWTRNIKLKQDPILSKGFTLIGNSSLKTKLSYDSKKHEFDKEGHFTVTRDSDNTSYYVYIFNGRIRLSEKVII